MDSCPLLMPALDTDFFWAGFKYKTDATTSAFAGSSLSSNANTYSLMLEPKLKFNLGNFRPYVGFGVGGTYIHADGSNADFITEGRIAPLTRLSQSRSMPPPFPSRGWPDWNISWVPTGR